MFNSVFHRLLRMRETGRDTSGISSFVKLALLSVVYFALTSGIVAAPMRIDSNWSVMALLGAQASLALVLIPNGLCVLTSAAMLRSHWTTLQTPQVVAASFVSFMVMLTVLGVLVFPVSMLQSYSEVLAWPTSVVLMVAPGVIAGQLFRFGRKRQATMPVTG